MADEDVAELDLGRSARRGYPEAVYCQHKTVDQLRAIAARVAQHPEVVTLFTRADAPRAAAVLDELPDAFHDPVAGLLVWPPADGYPEGSNNPPLEKGDTIVYVVDVLFASTQPLG